MKAPPTAQKLPASWPAALKAVGEAAAALLPEMIPVPVGATTRGVEVMRWVDEARTEEDFLGVVVIKVDEEVEVGVGVEVSSAVLVLTMVLVLVGV